MRYNRSAGQLTRRYAKVKSNAYIGRHISSIAIGTQFEKLPSIILGNRRNAAVTRQALAEKQIRPRRTLIPPNATRKKDSRSDACRALVPISTRASCSSSGPSPPISGINSAPLTVALIGLIKSRKSRDKSSSIGSIYSAINVQSWIQTAIFRLSLRRNTHLFSVLKEHYVELLPCHSTLFHELLFEWFLLILWHGIVTNAEGVPRERCHIFCYLEASYCWPTSPIGE